MSNVVQITELLGEKQRLFLQYEAFTAKALNQKPQVLMDAVKKRASVIEDIIAVDKSIATLIGLEADKGELIATAIQNSCNRSDLPAELLPVFDAAQNVYTVVNRVRSHDDELYEQLKKERADIVNGLKNANQKPKISKYLPKSSVGRLLNSKG